SSGRSYVATRCPRETSRGRGDIDRPGIRVVEVELHSTAELLPKGGLKRVAIWLTNRAPSEHAGGLVVQVIAESCPKGRCKGSRSRGSTSRGGAEGIEIAEVIPQAAVEVNIPNSNHFVAGIREERIVVKIIDSLN